MKIYKRTQFGNPILRKTALRLTNEQINSEKVKSIINNMKYTLAQKEYGIGLAAPQIGESIAVCIIALKPTPTRPNNKELKMTMINPLITKIYGVEEGMWEACISGSDIYAKASRFKRIHLRWQNEKGDVEERDFDGIVAQVIQHEVDHLNGILFVDRVLDSKTYITFSEYKKLHKIKNKKSRLN
jgi:peptide deformylase